MITLTAAGSFVVAVLYFCIGLLIFPSIRLSWKALAGSGLFFVGCALTHLHWAADLFAGEPATHDLGLMLAFHLMQVVGGALFVREMLAHRLVVRLEE